MTETVGLFNVLTVLRRELKIAFRKGRKSLIRCGFLIVITLFPLGIGPEPQLLAYIAGDYLGRGAAGGPTVAGAFCFAMISSTARWNNCCYCQRRCR